MNNAEQEKMHFNYQALDQFLHQDYDPKELGNQLDEIMTDLVHLSRNEDDFGNSLSEHHFTLRKLRDIFWWKLPKNYNHLNHTSNEQGTEQTTLSPERTEPGAL